MSRFHDTCRQAIMTRFHGHTETKGSRISASYAGGRIYVSCEDERMIPDRMSSQNHHIAAIALAEKLEWYSPRVGGWFNGDCYWIEGKDNNE